MNIYITGGTGFIGSYVVNELIKNKNNDIFLLIRNPQKIPELKNFSNVHIKKLDLYDIQKIKRHIKNIDALIHIALCWGETASDMIKNEVFTSINLIETAIKKGAKKIIFTSSTATLGNLSKNVNETSFRKPIDFYGAAKGSVELFINALSNKYKNVKINIIRPGYTFGNPIFKNSPIEPDNRFKDICKKVVNNEDITLIKNDGTQFIWAGDIAKLYVKVLKSNYKNEIFLGLSKNFITWEYIAKLAIKLAKSKSKIILINKNYSDKPFIYEVKKIKKFFGLEFNSKEKIKEHIEYLLKKAHQNYF